MGDIVSAISEIPESILGVIIGALLAFGGTFVATSLQLRHDAKQRERERIMELRRQAFADAVEGVPPFGYFAKLANGEVPLTDMGTVSSKPSWLNRLFTVAGNDTITAFADADASFGASIFELLPLRLKLDGLNSALSAATDQIKAINNIQESIRTVAAATARGDIEPPPAVLADMPRDWDQITAALVTAQEQAAKLIDERLELQRQLIEQALVHSLTYQRKLRKALLAMRTELDVPIDSLALERELQGIDDRMRSKFLELLDSFAETSEPAA